MIFAFSFAMPGIPFVFYGNEIGMRQLYDLPQIEGAYKPRAGGRTPMQWGPGKNLDFSTADTKQLYLPMDQAADAPTVAAQENDKNSLLNYVRELVRLKKTEPALAAYAEFVPVYAKPNTYPFVFARANGKDVILAVFNPADRPAEAQFTLNIEASQLDLLTGDKIEICNEGKDYTIKAPAITFALFKLK
jgi:maltose alpha-D-glucosyltransferase/alpha-amylase